jgi:hypothetical protein
MLRHLPRWFGVRLRYRTRERGRHWRLIVEAKFDEKEARLESRIV